MSSDFKLNSLSEDGIVAVVTINDIEDSNYLCDALISGGVKTIELTLRTKNVLNIMEHISKTFSDISIGAGTILSIAQLNSSIQSGALFGVAPGLDLDVVKKAQELKFPFAPGICTPSDIQMAIKCGCTILKFFPAEYSGGIKYLESIAAPYIQNKLKFIPLGGINMNNALKYLKSESILAIGGSWIAKSSLIQTKNWKEIQNRALEIKKLIREVKEK
ncbi:MAG: bifunctional 4-hydroxy-2-oxoglutarate aldolase/2-dehydro-3-deoxy-phosphogluconate aldolase [Candidatus Neomarinimicrobiota bacterium]